MRSVALERAKVRASERRAGLVGELAEPAAKWKVQDQSLRRFARASGSKGKKNHYNFSSFPRLPCSPHMAGTQPNSSGAPDAARICLRSHASHAPLNPRPSSFLLIPADSTQLPVTARFFSLDHSAGRWGVLRSRQVGVGIGAGIGVFPPESTVRPDGPKAVEPVSKRGRSLHGHAEHRRAGAVCEKNCLQRSAGQRSCDNLPCVVRKDGRGPQEPF